MPEEIVGPEAISPRSRPKPEDEAPVLSEAGRICEKANELVRHYIYEDKTGLVEQLQGLSAADLLDMAIGFKLSVSRGDYGGDDYEETVATILGEFCQRLATSRSI